MNQRETKYLPMTADQSMWAAAIFLTVIVIIFMLNIFGSDLYCWVKENEEFAAWIQAIFSVIAILAIWLQIRYSYNNQKKMVELSKLERLNEINKEISYTTRWLNLKLKSWEVFVEEWPAEVLADHESERIKSLVLMELREFERKLLKYSNEFLFDASLSNRIDVVLMNLKRLIYMISSGFPASDLLNELAKLKKNAHGMSELCIFSHKWIYDKLSNL